MLKIRLKRTGKKKEPHFRIVVVEARSRRDGRPVAALGSWHPSRNGKPGGPKEGTLILKKEEYQAWRKKGAVPTEAVRKLASGRPS